MINNKTPRLLAGIMLVVVCLLIPTRSQSDSEATPTYGEMTLNGAVFKYVKIDLTDPNIRFSMMSADGAAPPCCDLNPVGGARWSDNLTHTETLLSMYRRATTNAVAAINTDYFGSNGAPEGQFTKQGVKYQYNLARAVMGIPAWNGLRWPVHFKVSSFILGAQEGYRVAFGGSPLIKTINGVLTWDPENEKTTYPLDRKTKAVSRTAACKTADNRWLYLVAARDVNVDSLLSFFGAVGCVAGMEFDGGMSTTLVYLGTVKERSVLFPVGGGRPIGTGLVVWRAP